MHNEKGIEGFTAEDAKNAEEEVKERNDEQQIF